MVILFHIIRVGVMLSKFFAMSIYDLILNTDVLREFLPHGCTTNNVVYILKSVFRTLGNFC